MAEWEAYSPDGSDPQSAEAWLHLRGFTDRIADILAPVMNDLWSEAFSAGAQSAEKITGTKTPNLANQLAGLLAGQSAAWARQIAATTVGLIAAALATIAAKALIAKITEILEDPSRAAQIAITEITRLMALAAQWVYQMAGIRRVRWVTEHDAKVCPLCLDNQAAGSWPLGVPFPSGAPWPPQHPGCRCALVPVET